MTLIRFYQPCDYEQVAALYQQSDLFGGQFDPDKDSAERLGTVTQQTPNAIIVAEKAGKIVGTVSLIKDPRTAWLFRFAVEKFDAEISKDLFTYAADILQAEGHKQVLVYAPGQNAELADRYKMLGFKVGHHYACYWRIL